VRTDVEVQGVPLTIVDTAGLRPTVDPIEMLGIERTRAAIGQADVALVLVDASDSDKGPDEALLAELPLGLPRIFVHNKIDLAGRVPAIEDRPTPEMEGRTRNRHVFLSAKTGAGIDLLQHEVLSIAGAHEDMDGAFLARERHLVALREGAQHLASAAEHLDAELPALELLAEDLRAAQKALAAITGEFSADDLLGVIFSRFCIGK
jgi:tRNA modification GTPase